MTQKRFDIDMLPAFEGDAFWITYGDADDTRSILIDGGRGKSAFEAMKNRIESDGGGSSEFELGMVTHVDADHIEGILRVFKETPPTINFKDFWFNGFDHLDRESVEIAKDNNIEFFGAKQGEALTDLLVDKGIPWNAAFKNFPVVTPDTGELPAVELEDGMTVTVLSPSWQKLEKFHPKWKKEVEKEGLIPGVDPTRESEDSGVESFGAISVAEVEAFAESDFEGDSSEANGSSIAVVLEFAGKRALLLGDAHMDVIEPALKRFADGNDSRLHFDCIKISHHGSKGTVSKEFLELVDCQNYLISTNGSRHKHPNPEAIARILKFGGDNRTLHFNYRSAFSEAWDIKKLKKEFNYSAVYPDSADNGSLRFNLMST